MDETRHGNSPLEVLLFVMKSFLTDGRLKEAADIAKAAAPYVHPKAAPERSGVALADMRDEDLAELRRSSAAGADAEDASADGV